MPAFALTVPFTVTAPLKSKTTAPPPERMSAPPPEPASYGHSALP